MQTEKLYYQDPYLKSFSAKVKKIYHADGRSYVILDKTAFYPAGGGQPFDIRLLNGQEVYEVQEVDGEVRHYFNGQLSEGMEVEGEINWKRRFDHMQQHAGQHILSASFEDIYGFKTVSFHLGKEFCSIDLDVDHLTEEKAKHVEEIANKIVLENRSIDTKWVDKEELSTIKLRKKLSVSANIRLVIIPDIDYNGCGGTHPNSTGQVGGIKILHWEKQRKNIRIYFVCGNRVMQQLEEKHQFLQNLTSVLSAPQENLEQETNRILQHTKELQKTIDELKLELIGYEADTLLGQTEMINQQIVVKKIFENRSISELQELAKRIASIRKDILVIFVNGHGDKLQLICTRGLESQINMNDLVKNTLPLINGRGGGSSTFAQGGGNRIIATENFMEKVISYL